MVAAVSGPRCVLTYTNGREVKRAIIIDQTRAKSILGIVSQPQAQRIETGQRLGKMVADLRANGRFRLGAKVGVQVVNVETGLTHRVDSPLEVRDIEFLSVCLLDERQAAFELMASQLQRFIVCGDVTTIHAFYELTDPNKKIVV